MDIGEFGSMDTISGQDIEGEITMDDDTGLQGGQTTV